MRKHMVGLQNQVWNYSSNSSIEYGSEVFKETSAGSSSSSTCQSLVGSTSIGASSSVEFSRVESNEGSSTNEFSMEASSPSTVSWSGAYSWMATSSSLPSSSPLTSSAVASSSPVSSSGTSSGSSSASVLSRILKPVLLRVRVMA